MSMSSFIKRLRTPGASWFILALALALHVLDEALNDFLSFYNPAVMQLRELWSFFPIPTFSFDAWLTGLILGVAILFLLTPLANARLQGLRPLAVVLSVLMLANGIGHIVISIVLGTIMPGAYSSPVLILAAYNLLSTIRNRWIKA